MVTVQISTSCKQSNGGNMAMENVDFLGTRGCRRKKKGDANDKLPWTNGQHKQ